MVSLPASFGAPVCNLMIVPTSDEALEASAQRIFEISRDSVSSSSYSSDTDTSGLQEMECCSVDDTL